MKYGLSQKDLGPFFVLMAGQDQKKELVRVEEITIVAFKSLQPRWSQFPSS